ALRSYESAQLFAARAEVVRPGLEIDDDNAASIARICRGLDGSPLAIELAAARMRMLSVDEIADALENRLALLTAGGHSGPDRHRSLRAVLDWSHRLLTEPERRLFAELSQFVDGFGLDAAHAIHAAHPDDPDVFDLVAHLVDRSLVLARTRGGRTRYLLPETVRMYAAEHLERAGDVGAVQLRLLDWCVEFAERAGPGLSGPDQAQWLDRIDQERGNFGVALRRSLLPPGDPQEGLRIVASLWRFCYLRGYYTEGREWLDATLAATSDGETPSPVRARALVGAGTLAFLQCDYDEATNRLEDALAAYRAIGDERGVAGVLQSLGSVARERGRYQAARALHLESRALWRRMDDANGVARSANYLSLLAWLQDDLRTAVAFAEDALTQFRADADGEGIAWSLINLGASALYDGRHDQAEELLQESLTHSRTVGYREGVAWSFNLLGLLAIERKDPRRAAELLRESLREHWALGDRWRTASVLEALAAVDAGAQRSQRAARLLGAAATVRSAIGAPVSPVERRLLIATQARIDEHGGVEQREDAERLGRLAATGRIVDELLSDRLERAAVAVATPTAGQLPQDTASAAVAEVTGPPLLTVTALGGCRVFLDGTPITAAEFGYAKPRELLCFLLDRREATKEQIGVALWPWASPARLRGSFHTTLHHLRSALPADRIVFGDGRYYFDRSLPYAYDVETFETLLARSRTATNVDADLSAAVDLYHGDFLNDLVGESWIDERRHQLRRAFERALAALARLHARAGRYDDAIDVLHRAIAQDPLSEAAHRELMRCYAASGQRGSALRQYKTLSDLLRTELSTPPAPETAALHAQIRRGEPVPIE
ncbi:MAG TPA: BTAD domain-containing putative transcriptional regulator, partial [Jatrophihabitans sp.]|nr:BTAD domain-containing putative transcriptional regulator [Jatrophihabitans sp.]